MPELSSHSNTNVSKVWVFILGAFVLMCLLLWYMIVNIRQISRDTAESRVMIGELLSDDY